MMMNSTKAIIIIPAYQPDKRLIRLARHLFEKEKRVIVAVDDGSGPDYTWVFEGLKEIGVIVLTHRENKGKGAALKTAVSYCKRHFPISTGWVTADADGQHTPEDITALCDALEKHPRTLMLGVRDFSQKGVPLKSRWGNRISSLVFYLATGCRLKDTQTGLRGIPRGMSGMLLNAKGDRFELEANFLMDAAQSDWELETIPISVIYEAGNPTSHFNPVKDGFRVFSGMIRFTCSSLICSGVDLLLFWVAEHFIFGTAATGLILATVCARICSGTFNFILNHRWVFKRGDTGFEWLKYLALFLAQMGMSGLLVTALYQVTGTATIAKIIVDGSLFFISYWIQKQFIFCDAKQTERAAVKHEPY